MKFPQGKDCRLRKSLYGLKRASRQWNLDLTKCLQSLGFVQSKQDYSLFTRRLDCKFIAALVSVDDVLLTGDDHEGIQQVKQALDRAFTIKDLGFGRYFLGIEIAGSPHGTLLNQRKYIIDILPDVGLLGCKPAPSPLPTGLKLSIDSGDTLPNPEQYRRLIGRLLYLNLTRPDFSYAVQHLSQFLSAPKKPIMDAAVHVLTP